ncbi:MAG: DUF2784 domain-containing protein [Desulfobacteraceae bacterium]|nr:DUF2784 domain-containing protein [Desulfobacteraceae bacterium]
MVYWVLTNTVLVIHFSFILFVVFGGLLIFYKRWMLWLHIPAVFWGALIEFSGWICPLTPLENYFRRLAGLKGYNDGFVQHYLLNIIYPDGLTRQSQILLGLSVLMINLIVYFMYLKKQKCNK